jgi:aminoglycoside phosphotransferase (APT) family kinase protein
MQNTDRVSIDVSLIQRLIADQFPEWAGLPVKPVEFSGWDNRTFHLGEHMTVRLPSDEEYSQQVEKEQLWLPKLAPQLPLPIPTPLAMGKPGEGYPCHWSIYNWIDGNTASIERISNLQQFATALAEFLVALQKCNAIGGPVAGQHNFYRGGELATYDAEARQAITILENKIDSDTVTELWNTALASIWSRSPVWVHGDIAIGNLLVDQGQLSAVIDFGQLCIGDPACDLAITWTFFKGESRDAFRAAISLDRATWERARGWTLWKALIVYAGLPGTNPLEAERSRQIINEVLEDHKRNKLLSN